MEYLDETAARLPGKTAYAGESSALTFGELRRISAAIGSFLINRGVKGPVAVFMGKSPEAAAAFFGVIRGGSFYVPLDSEMSKHRISLILEKLCPAAMICSRETEAEARTLDFSGEIYLFNEIAVTDINEKALAAARDAAIDADPAYVVFTSGSTGTPKGVVASHRAVIDYIEHLSDILQVTEQTVFGSQTPLYVDACLKELICVIKQGASAVFIPKRLFMFPVTLLEYINANNINTVCWVASALSMTAALGGLDAVKPTLTTVAFGSESFPIKHLNAWRKALPNARFINLYGPTEATGMSCYYVLDRDFSSGESVPIGRPFGNTAILLLNGDCPVKSGEAGEICIRGSRLALGYYNDDAHTKAVFTQNPLNPYYTDRIYRTGDLGRYNEHGELVFVSRIDGQIKHLGYRIEPAEIEATALAVDSVTQAGCIYDSENQRICLFYAGTAEERSLLAGLKTTLPRYMLPALITRIPALPLTSNMKLDRRALVQLAGTANTTNESE